MNYQITCPDPQNPEQNISWECRTEILSGDILLIHNALPFFSDLIEETNKTPEQWVQSQSGKHNDDGQGLKIGEYDNRTSDSFNIGAKAQSLKAISNYLTTLIQLQNHFIFLYRSQVIPYALVTQIGPENFEILRYKDGGKFGIHIDAGIEEPFSKRKLSLVGFGNEDFEGGELEFPRQDVLIKPETSAVAMFPSNFTHPHLVKPVISGTRYSLVSWLY